MTLAYGQVISIKTNEKGKSGYVDVNGNEILPCKYDATYPFENGMGKVMKGNKYGLVDKTGAFVVQPKWDEINYDEEHNLYRVKSGKNYGLLDGKGQVLVKAQYLYISPFNRYGKALIAKGGKIVPNVNNKKNMLIGSAFGVLNVDGTVAIPAKFKGFFEFSREATEFPYKEGKCLENTTWYVGDTLATACEYVGFAKKQITARNAGILNASGEIIVPLKTAEWVFMPSNGMVRWYNTLNKKKFEIGYYNIQEKKKLKLQTISGSISSTNYWTHTDFMDEIAAFNDGMWKVIDKNGQTVKDGYSAINKGMSCGLWQAKRQDGVSDFFDRNGHVVFEGSGYTEAFFPRNQEGTAFNYIGVEKNGQWGLIDKAENVILPFEYGKVNDCRYGLVQVKKNGKWGVVDLQNKVVVPFAYESVGDIAENNPSAILVSKSDRLWYVYNIDQQKEMGHGYFAVGNFTDGIAWARVANMRVDDNTINRALSDDKAPQEADFAYIIDQTGQELIATPVPIKFMPQIAVSLKKSGMHVLSSTETKRLLLGLSSRQRHYPMGDVIAESDWDY